MVIWIPSGGRDHFNKNDFFTLTHTPCVYKQSIMWIYTQFIFIHKSKEQFVGSHPPPSHAILECDNREKSHEFRDGLIFEKVIWRILRGGRKMTISRIVDSLKYNKYVFNGRDDIGKKRSAWDRNILHGDNKRNVHRKISFKV